MIDRVVYNQEPIVVAYAEPVAHSQSEPLHNLQQLPLVVILPQYKCFVNVLI